VAVVAGQLECSDGSEQLVETSAESAESAAYNLIFVGIDSRGTVATAEWVPAENFSLIMGFDDHSTPVDDP